MTKTTRELQSNSQLLCEEQRRLLAFCQTQLCFLEKANFLQFDFQDSISDRYTVAVSRTEKNAELHHTFICLPTASNKAFVVISDTFQPELAGLTAFCCALSESNDAVAPGYVAELPASGWNNLRLHNWHGYMITALQDGLENSSSELEINGENFEVCLIVLLNSNEYKTAKKTNTEEQLTFFNANKRSLFQFQLYREQTNVSGEKKKPISALNVGLMLH